MQNEPQVQSPSEGSGFRVQGSGPGDRNLQPSTFNLQPQVGVPFGVTLTAERAGQSVTDLPVDRLRELVRRHRLLLLRGFAALAGESLPDYCRQWGPLLEWPFGTVLELEVHAAPKNYLFTPGSVPYHWDGAFAAVVPSFQVFQCLRAPLPGTGGETLFCETNSLLRALPAAVRERWEGVEITYSSEKVAHYGGRITAPLVDRHPHTGEPVLRFAEPPDADTAPLNPLSLEVSGMGTEATAALVEELRRWLYDPRWTCAHQWQDGDFLIADNHALLHARRPFRAHSPRHLQRVHVL
jgi:alpha-ketoglutarate-dependent taurine dioxygenase